MDRGGSLNATTTVLPSGLGRLPSAALASETRWRSPRSPPASRPLERTPAEALFTMQRGGLGIQINRKTLDGGNHYDHVQVGARETCPAGMISSFCWPGRVPASAGAELSGTTDALRRAGSDYGWTGSPGSGLTAPPGPRNDGMVP